MLASRTVTGAVALAAFTTCLGVATPAHAADQWGLNGTYSATSNGEWARTNDVFHDEQSVRSTWTISSQCSYPTECTGTVKSDFGWSAPIYQTGGEWYVKRFIPDWMPCFDGSVGGGLQVFRFHGSTPGGDALDPSSDMLVGTDSTTGQPGACGRNGSLFITMPFKLVKQG